MDSTESSKIYTGYTNSTIVLSTVANILQTNIISTVSFELIGTKNSGEVVLVFAQVAKAMEYNKSFILTATAITYITKFIGNPK